MVSDTVLTGSSTFTVAVNEAGRSSPSRRMVLNPWRANVTAYTPGRRSTIRYCPCPSVVAERTRSISAGLEASTVTPGSTPPEPVSYTHLRAHETPEHLVCRLL